MDPFITEPAVAVKCPGGTKKWWTEEEKKILVNRLLRDDPTERDLNNRTAMALLSFASFAVNTMVLGWLSERFNERLLFAAYINIWMLPFFIGLICIAPDANPWVRYTLLIGINGILYAHSIIVGLISRNAKGVGRRAVAAAYNMTYQTRNAMATVMLKGGVGDPTHSLGGGKDSLQHSPIEASSNSEASSGTALGFGSTANHIFSDPSLADYWRNKYEKAHYENLHRFDPEFQWTADEEKKLIRKVDLRIMLWAWIMFCALDLHRRNINRAISDNMLPELGMDTNDFNYGQTVFLQSYNYVSMNQHQQIFLVSFLAAELPSGLVSKKLGADVWIPFIMCGWSITAGSQAFLSNRAGYYAIKALLGLLMGGFIPDIVLWLTYFYKSDELPIRLAWFWTALSTVNIIGSLIAAGVLQMRGVAGWSGWRWLFLLEGIVTLIIGIFSWGLMPPGPCQTRNWFRGKNGWFSEQEELILVNRLLRDDPSKGDMNNRQAVGPRLLWRAVKDWEQWPLYLIGLTTYIPPSPPSTYLSFILRRIGFSVFQANLLAIPSQFLFAVNLLIISWVSERVKERAIISSISNIWIFPWLVALVTLGADANNWVRYAFLTGLLSYPYCHAILVSWNARNSNSVRTRAVSAALYNMCVQSGNIVASNIYREDDQPLYRRGNRILLGICCFNILIFYFCKAFYIWRNRIRDEKWNAMTREQQEYYALNTTDEGMKRLDFRFSH
ncbi:hypothetical protein S40288_09317 [Stachybotrys chartarum IBT 40288]|nr:hypothetical protein S40288_09317 [Stachybotrys chartarum IBT 40288]